MDDAHQFPDPDDAELWSHYLETCRRLGVEAVSPERARALIEDWNRTLRGEDEPTKH